MRSKTALVWPCKKERCTTCLPKSTTYETARKEKKRKAKKEVHGCGERTWRR